MDNYKYSTEYMHSELFLLVSVTPALGYMGFDNVSLVVSGYL